MIDVVGLGDSGWEGLPDELRRTVAGAAVLLGGRRHLELVPERPRQDRRTWPSPLRDGLPAVLAEVQGRGPVVALASGDPLRSGIGTTLVELLGADAVRIHPAVSSDTLARARMGWSAEGSEVVTLVGRDLRRIVPHLLPGARLVVLCADGTGPARLAELLVDAGLGASTLTARWHLGGPREGALAARADEWNLARTPDLVVACLEVRAAPTAGFRFDALGPAPGRPEHAFAHDGQITKRDVRASALAHLRPAPGAHLWDLGAGSGAIGLEWCLAAPGARCTAVERDPGRAGRAGDNSIRHGVAERHAVVVGDSADPAVLTTLGSPDAVFVGGGLSAELLDRVVAALPRGGRLVAHAVTLESEGLLVAAHARLAEAGWDVELTRVGIEHARPLGRYLGWTPARPVVQLSAVATGER
ncbi:precorrin-6y C5,15-methyltransferase (decarboxylating) subunit CbiE [Janibacter massiliensis]|uniref:precorrin-6y C5,15-methyltransferase (decarboxylating) subunit CbiE n=1 Tax=Janibacter massiliensis TaxID=2058291 RepID=UPI000D110F39|nr:precorrin-6y C5,15-methyltransferase (decarboxylating) subunit CbiE [Janibacter massiliensis]